MRKSVHSEGQKVFSAVLREAREAADLRQQELADRLKKHQSFVAKIEKGERRVDVVEFIWIARAIGADPVRLLKSLIRRGVGA